MGFLKGIPARYPCAASLTPVLTVLCPACTQYKLCIILVKTEHPCHGPLEPSRKVLVLEKLWSFAGANCLMSKSQCLYTSGWCYWLSNVSTEHVKLCHMSSQASASIARIWCLQPIWLIWTCWTSYHSKGPWRSAYKSRAYRCVPLGVAQTVVLFNEDSLPV